MRRDTMNTRTKQEADATQAALLLGQERYAEAIPYLQRAARSAKGDFKQARLYYLLGQIYHQQNQPKEAYKALQKCLKKSPPFELAFNARILQTETMAGQRGMGNKMIGKLKRMARSDNNKNYLDQVYYAIGNIHMAQTDTAAAISAYEKGRELSTRNGLEKGYCCLDWARCIGHNTDLTRHSRVIRRLWGCSIKNVPTMRTWCDARQCSISWCLLPRLCSCKIACKPWLA